MNTFKIFVALLLATVGFASCTNQEESAKVAQKIEKGEVLTQGDYTTIITYLGEFAEKVQPIQNQINNMESNNPESMKLTEEVSKIRDEHKYLDIFNKCLGATTEEQIGADNVALVNKYAGFEWFDAPDWATIETDADVAGMVVETPEVDTDTSVVAGAVDELQVKVK